MMKFETYREELSSPGSYCFSSRQIVESDSVLSATRKGCFAFVLDYDFFIAYDHREKEKTFLQYNKQSQVVSARIKERLNRPNS